MKVGRNPERGQELINLKNNLKNKKMYRKENGTYVFPQISKNAARAKWGRMLSGAGFFGMKHFTIGFANWELNLNDNTIECYTTYHADTTIFEMYRTNCKSF